MVADAAAENPPQWGAIKEVLDAPLDHVAGDSSWIAIAGMWLFLLPTVVQGLLAVLCPRLYVCMYVGTCCIPFSQSLCSMMGSVLRGRPLWMAWTVWRCMLGTLFALIRNNHSRLGLFLWEKKTFGGGAFWHGEGFWLSSYEECDQILQGTQERTEAFGCVRAATPDLYPKKVLIFLPNLGPESEWAAIRAALHQFFLDQGLEAYQTRLQRLQQELLVEHWKQPKLADLSNVLLVQRLVSQCMFYMMFGVWLTDEEATLLGNFRGYAKWFILPRMMQRFMFNVQIRKVKALRQHAVKLVEKYGQQELFVRVNESLGERWKRSSVVQLVDEVMFGTGFAGIGGLCAATESVGAFLQLKLPDESPGKKFIEWGQFDTSAKMVAKFREAPERFIRETCRLDPPVTSATTTLHEETKVTLAGKEYTLPKGVLKNYALSIANRDEGLFPDPKVFNPDRANLEKALTWNGAFGASNEASYPRICPGRHLSLELTKVLVSHALGPVDGDAAADATV